MKGYLLKIFKKSITVLIPIEALLYHKWLSVQSLLLNEDGPDEDGTVDWVKMCLNNQLFLENSFKI